MPNDQHSPRRGRLTQKDRQSAATKARLIEAARRLFREYGYHGVSVTEIAREAGVTHAMINVHFHSKAGLLYELIHENNDAQIAALEAGLPNEGTTSERLRGILALYAEHDLEDPQLMAVMQAYYWQWPRETEDRNRAQLVRALTPIANILRDDPGLATLDEGAVWSLIDAIYAIYTFGLRPAVYRDTPREACVDAIMERVDMLLDGARLQAQASAV
ncbi:TetR family transcriptional regulator [Salipiger bermudensis]|uniref:TetR/AcrR family transcriptional regulator n=1 Tax=Salipiger bermudensis TaxID=344736 RepID=UPI001C9942C8|nr:TetR/AcrR family transcriptional regulator [Salipiger bermudensis]MBY6002980.1 TetR family transcriptional regulator [Salipiger bermudensis]